jgi:transcriptional regulator with XRE-family HTH domain
MGDSTGDDSRRLADLLSVLVRVSGRSRRSIEEEMGLGSSALSKILGGTVRLQVSHLLDILAVLQVDPADFFHMAFPRRRLRQSPILEKARPFLQPEPGNPGNPGDTAGGNDLDELPEFEERVRHVLLKMILGDRRGRPQDPN